MTIISSAALVAACEQMLTEWHQYIPGVGDPWIVGSKCTHNDKRWICTAGDASGTNVWEPGVYGWDEVV